MRERKYVKFRVDMLSDTKAKIIDRKPERDLIHYVWMALVLLAGKVNLYGELHLSKNIPYTIETLSIELNREVDEVRLALDTLIELEMVELTKEGIYIVKNFAKHQNIKVKEKPESKELVKNEENKDFKNEVNNNKCEEIGNNKSESEKVEEKIINLKSTNDGINFNKNAEKVNNNIVDIKNEKNNENIIQFEKTDDVKNSVENNDREIENKSIIDKSKEKSPAILDVQINIKAGKGKNKDKQKKNIKNKFLNITDEEIEEEPLLVFSDGERTLMEGEEAIAQWSF